MAGLNILKNYRKTLSLVLVLMAAIMIAGREIIARPIKYAQAYRMAETELTALMEGAESNQHVEVKDSSKLDLLLIKQLTDDENTIINGSHKQLVTENGVEVVQFDAAFTGTYASIMKTWHNISLELPQTARVTSVRIAPERIMEEKRWALVARISIQMIRRQ